MRQIAVDLVNYRVPNMSIIVAGIDPTGPHIFIVDTNQNNNVDTGRYDFIGYATIGGGARHANAHFLTAGHAWYTPLPEALWNTYLAKKRAEVAPGVGETTDLYMIGPGLGSTLYLNEMVHGQLKAAYEKTKKQEEAARHTAAKEITAYVERLTSQVTEQPQATAA